MSRVNPDELVELRSHGSDEGTGVQSFERCYSPPERKKATIVEYWFLGAQVRAISISRQALKTCVAEAAET